MTLRLRLVAKSTTETLADLDRAWAALDPEERVRLEGTGKRCQTVIAALLLAADVAAMEMKKAD